MLFAVGYQKIPVMLRPIHVVRFVVLSSTFFLVTHKKDEPRRVYVQSSYWLHAYSIPRHGCHHIFASGITLLQITLYLSYSEHNNKGSEVMCLLL